MTIFRLHATDYRRSALIPYGIVSAVAALWPGVQGCPPVAKFWLKPVSLAKNKGFRQHELDRIAGLVVEYEVILVEA